MIGEADYLLKYIELPTKFRALVNDIDITSKTHLKACEKLAVHLASKQSRTPKEFEQDEYMKDFVVKSAKLNENMQEMIETFKKFLFEVADDARFCVEWARVQNDLDECKMYNSVLLEREASLMKIIKELKK